MYQVFAYNNSFLPKIMTTKESVSIPHETIPPEPVNRKQDDTENQAVPEFTRTTESKEATIVVEVVDMRIEFVKKRKHDRLMSRTVRWPLHSNTHRITF